MSEAIDVIEHEALTGPTLTGPRDAFSEFSLPGRGMERMQELADEVGGLIAAREFFAIIQGNRHIRVEGWVAAIMLAGGAARTAAVRAIECPDGTWGYEADVDIVRISTGELLGRATAGCFSDEGDVRSRHSALSMSQTRATSKAIAQLLRPLPGMAGYAATPAEEMTGVEPAARPQAPQPPRQQPQSRPAPQRKAPPQSGSQGESGREISEKQNKRLWAIAYGRVEQGGAGGWDADMIVRSVIAPREHSTEVQWGDDYEAVCAAIEHWQAPGHDGGGDEPPPLESGDPGPHMAPDGEPF